MNPLGTAKQGKSDRQSTRQSWQSAGGRNGHATCMLSNDAGMRSGHAGSHCNQQSELEQRRSAVIAAAAASKYLAETAAISVSKASPAMRFAIDMLRTMLIG